MSEYKEKLDCFKNRKKSLEDDLKSVKIDIAGLVMAECLKIHKVKPGSVIRESLGKGDEVKVSSVFPREDAIRQPSLKGFKKKKDGDWSKREVHVWEWSSNWVLVSE